MNEASATEKLVIYLAIAVVLEQCAAQPTVLYLDLINFSDEQDVALLNVSLDQTNAKTSNQSKNPFVIKTRTSSGHEDFYRHATLLLQQNVVALIDGSPLSPRACVLSTITGIPLIRFHGDHDHCHIYKTVLSLSAGYSGHARATVELLDLFHWTNIVVLHEANLLYETTYFRTLVKTEKTKVHLLQLNIHGNETIDHVVTRTIRELLKIRAHVVLLYAGEQYQRKLLLQENCKPSQHFVWILQGEIPANITADPNSLIVGFRLPRKHTKASGPFETKLRLQINSPASDLLSMKESAALSYDAGQVLAQALAELSNKESWAQLFSSGPYGASILRHMKEAKYEGVSGTVQFEANGLRRPIELDVVNLQNNLFIKTGVWSSSKGILTQNLQQNQPHGGDDSKVEGKKLKVLVLEFHPFIISTYNSEKNRTEYEGYCIDMLDKLASELKFTYEIKLSPDGAFGAKMNGTWNGLIGELVRKKADMALSGLSVTKSRESVVDFTIPFMYYTTKMIMKKKFVEKIDYLQFMMPFQIPVWVMVLVCLLVVTLCIFTLNYFSPYGYKNENGKGTSTEFNLFNSFWFALACMLQQGGDNTPKSLSGRVLVGCYWFCILVWVATYTANLAAFFTVKSTRHHIRNLEDALKSDYGIGVTMSSFTYEFFRSSRHKLYQEAWKKMNQEKEFPAGSREGFEWARQRDYIFIGDGPVLEYQVQKEPCDLTTVPCLNMETGLAIAMQENDLRLKEISLTMLRLRQKGYLDALRTKWWDHTSMCREKKATGVRIDLQSMAGVYIVLSVGLLLSFIILGAEILWHRKAKKKMDVLRPNLSSSRVRTSSMQLGTVEPEVVLTN